ncbi:putative mitogen-activated protein kinase CMGC-MAPK family [Rosa chinensis]|uniref:Putative mitogen-activated protein kinase CMGC-MAPK family n=1 Tax=Rosa chinensis TaxID=74649 RepID=A0A2P6P5X9_ROSCH|nr:putative mitogen-activated protein kinase CMGC-MAPK family [Rosa chinensis]
MLPSSQQKFRDIYVVFELMESYLHRVIKANDGLTQEHYQFFLYQVLRGLKYIHTANDYVATRWYRASELCASFFSKFDLMLERVGLLDQVLLKYLAFSCINDPLN